MSSVKADTQAIDTKVSLIYKSSETKKHKWNNVKTTAPVMADYILLLFRSSGGEIAGSIRIKDSEIVHPFSTLVNNRIPVVIHNQWLPEKKQYRSDLTLEYEISETSEEKNSLSILNAGFRMSSGM